MVRCCLIGGLLYVALVAPSRSALFAQAGPVPREPRAQAIDSLTASIGGRVTTADSGAPIRRAEVRAMSTTGISRLVTTDGEGRFELRDLPAGEYRVVVSKSGFVPLTYGQRRPFEAPRPITLRQGQRASANLALPRASAIAGQILDQAGEPLDGMHVQALRLRVTDGRRRLEPVGAADRSDDTGAFRLYGLPPGTYYVTASPSRSSSTVGVDNTPVRAEAALARVATVVFYPGTTSPSEALPVTVGAGGEVRADLRMAGTGAAAVSGTVFTSAGALAADASVTLRSTELSIGAYAPGTAPPLVMSGHTNADGTFAIPNVPPGSYDLTATLSPLPPGLTMVRTTTGEPGVVDRATGSVMPLSAALRPERASIPVVVTDAGLDGVSISTRAPGTLEGMFVADAGVLRPLPEKLGISVGAVSGGDSMMQYGGQTFRLTGLGGLANLTIQGLPDTWMMKSIIVNGVDRTDEPLDFRNGGTAEVRIVLTDRVTRVTGTVRDASSSQDGGPRDYTVVIFPEDPTKWTFPSRYVRSVRTDEQGAFRVTGLPPERYFAAPLEFVEDGAWTAPEFLESIRPGATGFSLADGEQRALDLRPLVLP